MDKYVGKKLDGRYEIRELIGIGGMANVYRCYDTVDDREVAIKILKDEYLNNEEFIRRFKNESKAIAVLSHPNIVKVYDVSFGDMIQYIVMEYIDGITLKEYINQQGILTWKETVHLITQILKALSHAHSKGVVHRDIKPQNMMLLSDGTIKVTDFGIARFSNSARTITEQAIGSVHYIAPEQAKGDITDGKTDIYSIGVMMYEMLTGKLPFDGDNAVSVALMHLQVIPENPRNINQGIPEGIEEITIKAMQKQPMDRYQSAQDMLQDIERFRMNPSVRFEYKYFTDKQQTKYMNAVSKGKISRAEEFAQGSRQKDDDDVRHSVAFPIFIGIIIAAFLAVAVCVPYGIYKASQLNDVPEVDVPDFVGQIYDEQLFSGKYDFKFVTDSIPKYDENYEIGEIVDQQPNAYSKQVKADSKIILTINTFQGERNVPEVVGVSEADARKLLREEGFINVESSYVNSSEPKGTVVSTYPESGNTLSTSSTVYIFVSKESKDKEINVIDITDKTREEAREILEEAGFTVDEVAVDTDKPSGTIIMQSPICGKLNKGDTIIVYYDNSMKISVDMPGGISHSMVMKVVVGETNYPEQVISGDKETVSFTAKGEGITTVQVYLDDQLYREYNVNFSTGLSEVTVSNEYIDSAVTEPSIDATGSEETTTAAD